MRYLITLAVVMLAGCNNHKPEQVASAPTTKPRCHPGAAPKEKDTEEARRFYQAENDCMMKASPK